tara:strand:+ start:348 stop:1817 length:1470 start_codon:yes stop_codon:yes gene_type:complete
MKNYKKLESYFKELSIYDEIISILNWDMATMMPKKSRSSRISQIEVLNENKKNIFNILKKNEFFKRVNKDSLNLDQQRNFELMKKSFDYFDNIPIKTLNTISRLSFETEGLWREAREKNNFLIVKKKLHELFSQIIKKAEILSNIWNKNKYDSLITLYDESFQSSDISSFFLSIETFVKPIYKKSLKKKKSSNININLSEEDQLSLSKYFMKKFGFDFKKGRVDKSLHPFCGGFSNDIRITSRFENNNSFSCFEALMHETGHALYELGLPKKWKNQPIGQASGMSMHESQSLFFEMQITKSVQFYKFLELTLKNNFKKLPLKITYKDLKEHGHAVKKNFIRVNADELSYPLHVIHRFNLEKKLVLNPNSILELPDLWNSEFYRLLGFRVLSDNEGCLQDIHWYSGDFGYFPTYCIGAMIAAQLKNYCIKKNPSIFLEIKKGNFRNISKWLKNNVHQFGNRYTVDEHLLKITGSKLSTSHYIDHLSERYQ